MLPLQERWRGRTEDEGLFLELLELYGGGDPQDPVLVAADLGREREEGRVEAAERRERVLGGWVSHRRKRG